MEYINDLFLLSLQGAMMNIFMRIWIITAIVLAKEKFPAEVECNNHIKWGYQVSVQLVC